MKINKELIFLGLILVAGFILRFTLLGLIPNGSTPDEVNYIYQGYSIVKTGEDIFGRILPLSFNNVSSFSPVPVYSISIFLKFLDLSLLTARLPFALAGFISVILIFLITKDIFNSMRVALLSTFVFSLSPWAIQMSRIAYDYTLALFFALLGTYIFIKFKNSKFFLLSLIPFLLSFYSYHAFKLFFIFYLPLLFIFFIKDKVKRKNGALVFFIGIIFMYTSFLFVAKTQNVTRQEVFIWNYKAFVSQTVNDQRQNSSAPNILKDIYSNKLSVVFATISNNYLGAFSPEFLFTKGDKEPNTYIYNIGERGMLYLIDLPLLLLGILYSLKLKRNIKLFLVLGLLISPLPSTFTFDQTYGARSIAMLPFLTIFVALGIENLFQLLIKYKTLLAKIGFTFIIVLYLVFASSFIYQYFFRYSIYGDKYWNSSKVDLVKYLYGQKDNYKNIIVSGDSNGLILYYGLFNKIDPVSIRKALNSDYPKKLGNISFIYECIGGDEANFNPKSFLPQNTLYTVEDKCYQNSKFVPIKTITWKDLRIHTDYKLYAN